VLSSGFTFPRVDFFSSRSKIAALATKFDTLNLPNYYGGDESSEEEEGSSNRSNASLNHQSKKKKCGGN
jgi:hypothetical protein